MMAKKRSEKQQTLKESVHFSGIALHTGIRAHLQLHPGKPDSGYILVRGDLDGKPEARAIASNVVDVQRATTIAVGGQPVHTVEHVLAALYASGIDNAVIELDGPEPPVVDGSSRPFMDLIRETGVVQQKKTRQICVIDRPIWVEEGDSKMLILPHDDYHIRCTVQYGASLMDTQYRSLTISDESFYEELSLARTFCLYEEIEYLMKADLIRGGSLDSFRRESSGHAVIKGNAVFSNDGLRYPDEFVRHKMLDIVGDLSLTGCRLQGEIIGIRPGHQINVKLAQEIMKEMKL